MRLKNKFEILELLSTLEEGFDYIGYVSKCDGKNMLDDCISVLNRLLKIIKQEKIYDNLIKILEKSNSIEILLDNNSNINNSIYLIKTYINELKDIIINKIDTEFEILFLPYKVSMWDSLKSIWESAMYDDSCNCSVVPIPYYELDSNGEIKRQCYEGNYFDKNIDIIDYNKYDIKKIQPDIVYIHNPYDNYNRITMIEPRYFSKNIINYTNMLVYVPYFLAGSYKNLEEAYPMYKSPGCINADRIIAQSYKHKDLLIDVGYDNKKIIPLGSPKIDFIIESNKKLNNLCKNFSNKKVFLLSTGINDLLCYNNWIDILIEIILSFVNNNDISLIWRPHPLTEITITTMRNNLISKFKTIDDIIKKSENIIIDDSPEFNESVNISDALISDYSSLMFQYIATKKPVLSLINKELNELDRIYCLDYLGVYSIYDINIDKFINLVINNSDYKAKERIEGFKNSLINSDGKSGEKIHSYIKEDLYQKIKNFNNK